MRITLIPLYLLLFAGLIFPWEPVQGNDWEAVATGIQYNKFFEPGPNIVHVARMERWNPNVTLESSLALGRVAGGTETVSGMAERYQESLSVWGGSWGKRNRVVAAINGSFFDPETGIANRGVFHSGWYAKRFDDLENGTGFAWKDDRSAFIGGCVVHRTSKQFITFYPSEKTQLFQGINTPRGENELVVYTPQYDENTGTDDSGVEVLVEMTRPLGVVPAPQMAFGYVREIVKNRGSTPIPFDSIVLSASGPARQKLLREVYIGQRIGISQDIRHYQPDCQNPAQESWDGVYASIGGSFPFLLNGEIQTMYDPGATSRAPRTAIAFNGDYIYFIVVDGRNPGVSEGMTIQELAEFTLGRLQAEWAIAEDGGGSSTLWVDGEVKNFPNAELFPRYRLYLPDVRSPGGRSIPYAPGIPGQAPYPAPEQTATPTYEAGERTIIERQVANGMLMVVLEPMQSSKQFRPYERVQTTRTADILLGPGENYAVISSVPAGTPGQIRPHIHRMNGVWAKGAFWWKVSFGDWTGWVDEGSLSSSGGN